MSEDELAEGAAQISAQYEVRTGFGDDAWREAIRNGHGSATEAQTERTRTLALLTRMAERVRWGIDAAKDVTDKYALVAAELELRRAAEAIRCCRHLPAEECLNAEPNR